MLTCFIIILRWRQGQDWRASARAQRRENIRERVCNDRKTTVCRPSCCGSNGIHAPSDAARDICSAPRRPHLQGLRGAR